MLVPTVIIGMRMALGATWPMGLMQNTVLVHCYLRVVGFTGPRILQFAKLLKLKEKLVIMVKNISNNA